MFVVVFRSFVSPAPSLLTNLFIHLLILDIDVFLCSSMRFLSLFPCSMNFVISFTIICIVLILDNVPVVSLVPIIMRSRAIEIVYWQLSTSKVRSYVVVQQFVTAPQIAARYLYYPTLLREKKLFLCYCCRCCFFLATIPPSRVYVIYRRLMFDDG